MSDLIYRQAAIDAFDEHIVVNGKENADRIMECLRVVIGRIKALPSAQPERKKGRWISADEIFHGVPFYCSECGEVTRDTVMRKPRWNFCPNCGADMRGEDSEKEVEQC